ncbi:MAG: SprT family zinc-dependent metalloprotease [Saprospiraceae bacterium]|jgi:predicted metal-dependent hydrolase|nr:SprT family zinc-dependent metalloprotease [Saprospiraceae bacterium]
MLREISYNIRRSKRKTISIYVERDGSVSVLAPKEMDDAELDDAIKTKEYLIYKHLSAWEDANRSRMVREYVNGQSFLYLGRNYRLRFVDEQDVPLKLQNGYFKLRKSDKLKAQQHFIDFYKSRGLPHINRRVEEYKKRMDVEPKNIRIMELQNRWASCSKEGNLNFHWKCLMAVGSILDYIVVHELAHIKYHDHSPDFWNEVDKIMPDYRRQVEWLKEHGAGMDL